MVLYWSVDIKREIKEILKKEIACDGCVIDGHLNHVKSNGCQMNDVHCYLGPQLHRILRLITCDGTI